ncbi:MAG: NADH-quinone oxidoreductase subunit M [Abitibacteriaceae bacterium]|nr:NADH-quinone oxidoreductase subunit M [Abditibacteriaceae bacterium]
MFMNAFDNNLLIILIFLPMLGALLVGVLPRAVSRTSALVIALVNLALSVLLLLHWPANAAIVGTTSPSAAPAFEQYSPWLQAAGYGVTYHLGVDGISVFLILLTTFLTPIVIVSSWTEIQQRTKEFMVCLLLLEGTLVGVFSAIDVILFYIFWELVLVPMYLMIGVWGGPRRIYAGIKFFLYTMIGSVLMWIAMLYVLFQQSPNNASFDYGAFKGAANFTDAHNPAAALWLFAAFALAFAIKVPLFPLHTWQPDAYEEAPTGGTVMLAAVLSKMGVYGFIRFAIPFFPSAARVAAPLIIGLAITGIIYGAFVAVRQTDIKRLLAYSSISHLGFIMLGVFASLLVADNNLSTIAMSGATIQMLNHGISTGALFLLVGMLYERRQTNEISQYGGLMQVMPRYTVLFWIALFASIGLPGLNGFVGEYLILQGSMAANFWYTALAATGVIWGAVYMLRMFRSVMFGELTRDENRNVTDVNARETALLVAALAFAVIIGVMPQPFLNIINPNAQSITTMARAGGDAGLGARSARLNDMAGH